MTAYEDENIVEEPENNRPGPLTMLLLFLLVLAMLATLIWPLLRARPYRQPTPTPFFLRQAQAAEFMNK